jgi:hypothetical protein
MRLPTSRVLLAPTAFAVGAILLLSGCGGNEDTPASKTTPVPLSTRSIDASATPEPVVSSTPPSPHVAASPTPVTTAKPLQKRAASVKASGAALVPKGLTLFSVTEQDGEELTLGFKPSKRGRAALDDYRRQLSKAGWAVSAASATKGRAKIGFFWEGGLAVTTPLPRIPELSFKRLELAAGADPFPTFIFETKGKNDQAMSAYRAKLTKNGFRITDIGGAYEASKNGVVMHFLVVDETSLHVTLEALDGEPHPLR